jgi:hypothetical protein
MPGRLHPKDRGNLIGRHGAKNAKPRQEIEQENFLWRLLALFAPWRLPNPISFTTHGR